MKKLVNEQKYKKLLINYTVQDFKYYYRYMSSYLHSPIQCCNIITFSFNCVLISTIDIALCTTSSRRQYVITERNAWDVLEVHNYVFEIEISAIHNTQDGLQVACHYSNTLSTLKL